MTVHTDVAPAPPVQSRRTILGMSAVLLPFTGDGDVDWGAFTSLVERTVAAGLVPAVNMDTGYVQLLDDATRGRVLDVAAAHASTAGFVAGAFVADAPGASFDLDAYLRAMEAVASRGGTPVVFPSCGLNALDESEWVAAHDEMGRRVDRFIGFELGSMFVPYGRIYSVAAYEGLLEKNAQDTKGGVGVSRRVSVQRRLAIEGLTKHAAKMLQQA